MYFKITGVIAVVFGIIAGLGFLMEVFDPRWYMSGDDFIGILLLFILLSTGVGSYKYGKE